VNIAGFKNVWVTCGPTHWVGAGLTPEILILALDADMLISIGRYPPQSATARCGYSQ